jgi:hypothetical protein
MPSPLSRRAFFAYAGGSAGALRLAPKATALGSSTPRATASDGPLVALRTPIRVFDSRSPSSPLQGRKLPSGQSVAVTLSGAFGDIQSGFASIVFVNCTITDTVGAGYLVVRGSDLTGELPLPNTSNINWTGPRQTVANLVMTTVGGENALEVHCAGPGSTHLIVDVQGYVPFLI